MKLKCEKFNCLLSSPRQTSFTHDTKIVNDGGVPRSAERFAGVLSMAYQHFRACTKTCTSCGGVTRS